MKKKLTKQDVRALVAGNIENLNLPDGEYKFGGFTLRLVGKEYGWERQNFVINGGLVCIEEMPQTYLCFNLRYLGNRKFVYAGPNDQGFVAGFDLAPPDENGYEEQTLTLPENNTSFEVYTGFYGVQIFHCFTLDEFFNQAEAAGSYEKAAARKIKASMNAAKKAAASADYTHRYHIERLNEEQCALYIMTRDGRGVAGVLINGDLIAALTSPWKKIMVMYYNQEIDLWVIAKMLNHLVQMNGVTTSDAAPWRRKVNPIYWGEQISEHSGAANNTTCIFKGCETLENFMAENYFPSTWEVAAANGVPTNMEYITFAQQAPYKYIVPCF